MKKSMSVSLLCLLVTMSALFDISCMETESCSKISEKSIIDFFRSNDNSGCFVDLVAKQLLGKITDATLIKSIRTFSPDNKVAFVECIDGKGCLYDVATGESLTFLPAISSIKSIDFSCNNSVVLIRDIDKTGRLLEISTGKQLGIIPHAFSIKCVPGLSPDNTVAYCELIDGHGCFWDVVKEKQISVVFKVSSIKSIMLPSSELAFITPFNEDAYFFDIVSGKKLGMIEDGAFIKDIKMVSKDNRILFVECADGSHCFWNSVTGQRLGTLCDASSCEGLMFSPDNNIVFMTFANQVGRFFDVVTGQPRGNSFHVGSYELIESMQFEDNNKFSINYFSCSARYFDYTTGRQLFWYKMEDENFLHRL